MTSEYVETGVPFLRSLNVREHRIDLADVRHISAEFDARLKKSRLRPGDVVTVRTGKPGATAVIPHDLPVANCSDLVITRPGNALEPRWLSYYINGVAEGFVASRLVGAVQQHFNVGAAKEMVLLLPPLLEQRAIAEVLGALDEKIAANRRATSLGRSLLMAHWTEAARNPVKSVHLEHLVEISPRVPTTKGAAAPYLDMKNLPEYGLLVSEWSSREPSGGARFCNGDTLVARITPCFENGKIAWVDFLSGEETGYGSTEYIVLRARAGVPALVPYVIAASADFRTFAAQHRTGTSGRQRVQARDLGHYLVGLPPSDRLAEFGALADSLVRRLGAARTESRALAATRDELLPLLMSGRITVKDAERRVEEEV